MAAPIQVIAQSIMQLFSLRVDAKFRARAIAIVLILTELEFSFV
jgi:hypothetical protein